MRGLNLENRDAAIQAFVSAIRDRVGLRDLRRAGAAAVRAQTPPAPPPPAERPRSRLAPSKPVAIILPVAVAIRTYEAFRKQLATIAQKKDRAALSRLVSTNFFWIPEDRTSRTRASPASTICARDRLDGRDALGWEAIAGYAVEQTAMSDPQRRRRPVRARRAELRREGRRRTRQRDADTDASDWGYPAKNGIDVRADAQASAPVVDKLGLYLVAFCLTTCPPTRSLASFVR